MKVCVLGGSGFIGSYVVKALAAQGHDIVCLLRDTSDASRIASVPFERKGGDLFDAASLERAFEGCDAVIHLALSASWEKMRTAEAQAALVDAAEHGTRHALAAAEAAGCSRFVYVSSLAAVGCSRDPRDVFDEASPPTGLADALPYTRAKRRAEAVCAEFSEKKGGLDVVVLNPAEVYGADDTDLVTAGNLKTLINDWPAIVTRTGGTAVCAAPDVSDAIVSALVRGRAGERYVLGGPNLTIADLAATTLKLAGQANKWTLAVPTPVIRAAVRASLALSLPPPIEPGVLDFAVLYWFADSSKAEAELGYRTRAAEDILKPAVDWLRAANHIK